jgi:hypothetical protein
MRGVKILFVSLRLGKRGQLFLQTEQTEARERSRKLGVVVRGLKHLHDLKRKKCFPGQTR